MKNLTFLTQRENVFLVEMENQTFYSQFRFGGRPALVFIDAGHSYEACRRDILFAIDNGAHIVCGDDFSHAGVERAVRETFDDETIELVGDMWVVRWSATQKESSTVGKWGNGNGDRVVTDARSHEKVAYGLDGTDD